MKALKSLLIWISISAILAAATAWLTWLAGCLYSPTVPLCRHDYGGAIVALAGLLLALFPVAYTARQRALRAAGRGMYARPVGGAGRGGRWLEQVAHLVIEGEWPGVRQGGDLVGHPLIDIPPGYGWRVPMSDGSEVVVYCDEFWQWLNEAWQLQRNPEHYRKGATSQRVWDPLIGRPQTQARNYLLEVAGALRRNRATANSTRRIDGTPWEILEKLVAEWPPGEV